MEFIRQTAVPSITAFKEQMLNPDRSEWGPSILPVPVRAGSAQVSFKRVGAQWEPKDLQKLERARDQLQNNLFVPDDVKNFFKILKRIPYRMYVSFEDLEGERINSVILDWEIGSLWFNVRESSTSDEEALEKIRMKIENQIFDTKREPYLVLGSMHHRFKRRDLLAVDAFIWPEKPKPQLAAQPNLFGD